MRGHAKNWERRFPDFRCVRSGSLIESVNYDRWSSEPADGHEIINCLLEWNECCSLGYVFSAIPPLRF